MNGSGVEEVLDLGFGKCKLQVQVPEEGKIKDPKELVGRNVVTSFTGLTERYFRALEEEVLGEDGEDGKEEGKRKLKTNIMYVGGSVEAACALGVADGIVDLVGRFLLPYFFLLAPRLDGDSVTHQKISRIRRNNACSRPHPPLHRPPLHSRAHQIHQTLQPGPRLPHNLTHQGRHRSPVLRPLPIQHPASPPTKSERDHAGQEGADGYGAGGGRVGGY